MGMEMEVKWKWDGKGKAAVPAEGGAVVPGGGRRLSGILGTVSRARDQPFSQPLSQAKGLG